MFEEFIEQLLPCYNPFPGKNSVLVMDNTSIHRSERIRKMCDDVSVKLEYLPLYLPDLNLIKEHFAQLKAFIKRH
jgi:transposase